MNDLKTLTSVELSEVWENEPEYFTPWLARDENLTLLGEALGMELELDAQEINVGGVWADLRCKNIGMWDNFSHTPRDWMRIPLSGLPRRSGRSIVRCLTGRTESRMNAIVSLVLR